MKITPVRDNILIYLEKVEEMIGKFYVPDQARVDKQIGVVKGIGDEVECKNIKIDSRILMGKYSGIEFKEGNERCFLVKEEDILAIVE